MAKGIYVGGTAPTTIHITTSNISEYFTVTNESYYFAGVDTVFTSNNGGIGSSTAQTTLTAKNAITNISFSYSYSSEANYDKFTLTFAGTTIENAVSGSTTTKTYSGSLSAGQSIVFKYVKDSSVNGNDDKCTFYDIKVQDGTTKDNVARKVEQPYVGIDGIARKVTKGYIGVNNVARECYLNGIKWNKYDCTTTYYYESYTSTYHEWGTSPWTEGKSFTYFYESCDFSSTAGFNGYNPISGTFSTAMTVSDLNNILANTYRCSIKTESEFIVSVTEVFPTTDPDGNYLGHYIGFTGYKRESTKVEQYIKGVNFFGKVIANENELPEEGTLIEGSATGSYCVLQIDGTYYYYEKA